MPVRDSRGKGGFGGSTCQHRALNHHRVITKLGDGSQIMGRDQHGSTLITQFMQQVDDPGLGFTSTPVKGSSSKITCPSCAMALARKTRFSAHRTVHLFDDGDNPAYQPAPAPHLRRRGQFVLVDAASPYGQSVPSSPHLPPVPETTSPPLLTGDIGDQILFERLIYRLLQN